MQKLELPPETTTKHPTASNKQSMAVPRLNMFYASIGHSELTENDVICLSNLAKMKKTIGNRRLRFMLEKYSNRFGTKKEILSRVLSETQRLNPPMRFLRYDIEIRKYRLMDAKDALRFINSELLSLKHRPPQGKDPCLKSVDKVFLKSRSETEQKVCISEEARETAIANLLIGIKGSVPSRPQRQGRKTRSENNPIMANKDQYDSRAEENICGANKGAANTTKQKEISLYCNSTGSTIYDPNEMDIIFSTKGNVGLTSEAVQLFRCVLEETTKTYPTTGNVMELASRMFSTLQEMNPPMRFLRCNANDGGYSLCDSRFAMNEISKCFDGMLSKQRWQKDCETKLSDSSSVCFQSKGTLALGKQASLSLPRGFPIPKRVCFANMSPNPANEAAILVTSKPTAQSQEETRRVVPKTFSTCPTSTSRSSHVSAESTTAKTNDCPFVTNLPTPQSIQAAYVNPKQTNQPLLQVHQVTTTQTPQFGSAIGNEELEIVSNDGDAFIKWPQSCEPRPLNSYQTNLSW